MNKLQAPPAARIAPDIIAHANRHDISFWDLHPDVLHVRPRPVENEDDCVELSIWLGKPTAAAAERGRTRAPDRKPDIEIGADGIAHPTFWDRFPEVEHLELFQEYLTSKPAPYGWWHARIWTRGGATIAPT